MAERISPAYVFVFSALLASSALADSTEKEAQKYFIRGKNFYASQRYQEALEAFQQAYSLAPTEDLRLNIGYSLWGLNRTNEASREFHRFLRSTEEETARQAALQALTELEGAGPDGFTDSKRRVFRSTAALSLASLSVAAVAGLFAVSTNLQNNAQAEDFLQVSQVSLSIGAVFGLASTFLAYTTRGTRVAPITLIPTQATAP
jgi:tetratricopeptide (TPR) repeat protein